MATDKRLGDDYSTIRDSWSFRELLTANAVLDELDFAAQPKK